MCISINHNVIKCKLFISGKRKNYNRKIGTRIRIRIRIRIHPEARIRIHYFQMWIRGSGSGSTIPENRIRGSGSGSTIPKCGSKDPDPDPRQNEMDPQHWTPIVADFTERIVNGSTIFESS